ncbi:Sodium-coupled monocarboxylate transporter 1 [Armadillidium vulgare]|nr:Sodium-coupled monocarboxylate transporter 1 [Armadillidium vulgare]
MDDENGFGVVDYCAFAGMLVISSAIGFYMSYKGSKSPEEFLLGLSGETYANGMQISIFTTGIPFAVLFSSHFILPVLYPLKLTSINEYIELRFKSKRLRFVMFLATMVYVLALSSISLYSSTIALSSVTNFSTLTSIFILGVICTLYSSFVSIKT